MKLYYNRTIKHLSLRRSLKQFMNLAGINLSVVYFGDIQKNKS